MKRKPTLAPRNPLVAPSMFRKAGAHDKSHKAKRRAAKVDLQRGCSSQVEHPAFTRTARVRASPPPPTENPNDWHGSQPFVFSTGRWPSGQATQTTRTGAGNTGMPSQVVSAHGLRMHL